MLDAGSTPSIARTPLPPNGDADDGDTETSRETLITAAEQIEAVLPAGDGLQEVVGDKGYHSNQSLLDLEAVGVRSYLSEPDRGRRNWKKKTEACAAVYRNRRRIRGARGLRLLRLRGERLERPLAHLYETGGKRRVAGTTADSHEWLHLGLLMRQLIGFGTPRGLHGRLIALVPALLALIGSPFRRPNSRVRFGLLATDNVVHSNSAVVFGVSARDVISGSRTYVSSNVLGISREPSRAFDDCTPTSRAPVAHLALAARIRVPPVGSRSER